VALTHFEFNKSI